MDQWAKRPKAVSRSADHRSPRNGPRRGYVDALGAGLTGKLEKRRVTTSAMGLKLHSCSELHGRGAPKVKPFPDGSAAGGGQSGVTMRSATWSNDVENQLTSRLLPGHFEGVGQANPTATVTVNTLSTYRRGEYFRKEVTGAAAGEADAGVDCRALADGGVDARVEPPAGSARGRRQASEATERVSIVSSPPAGRVEGASDRSEIEAVRPKTKPVAPNC